VSDLVGIWLQILINPEIQIRIPDQILALAEFALYDCSCSCYMIYLVQPHWQVSNQ